MSDYTVDFSELHGMGCTGVELTVASLAADVVRLEFVSDVVGAVPVPWRHGDRVTLMDGDVVQARGWVLDAGVEVQAGGYEFSVELGNVVALMDAVPYAEGQGFRGYVQDETRLVSAAEMVGVLARAGAKAPGGGDSGDAVVVDFDAEVRCPTGTGSQSCWSLVGDVLRWVPDVVSFYEAGERRLSFCRGGERGRLVLDVPRGRLEVRRFVSGAVRATGWLRISNPWPGSGVAYEIGGVLRDPNVYGGGYCSAKQWVEMLNDDDDLPVVAEVDSEDDSLVRLVAKVPGVAGNGIALRWLEGAGFSFSGDFLTGGADEVVDVELVGRFGGVGRAGFRPRYDLQPPVVGMVWADSAGVRREFVLPEGGDLRQPWAFLYEVPEVGAAGGLGDVLTPQQERLLQVAAGQRMEVLGVRVPRGWVNSGDMRQEADMVVGEVYGFWRRFFPQLGRTGLGCLRFGQAVFEPVGVDVAFPPPEEGDDAVPAGQPANYEEFQAGKGDIFLLHKGQFPASAEARDNVSGLRFCHGVLKQYVWLGSEYVGTLSEAERREFFCGSWSVRLEDGSRHGTRYALLTLRGVFINRRRKCFATGTNSLQEGDDDFSAGDEGATEDGGAGGDVVTLRDYREAVRGYYEATRRLLWDGGIQLLGVEGVRLARLVGCGLRVLGLRGEWEDMDSPVQQVVWRPFEGVLDLSVGSAEVLSVDERVERLRLARVMARGAGLTLPPEESDADDEVGDGDSGEEDDGDSGFAMVAPSVCATQAATVEGRPLNPFEVFQEGERWFMNEGVFPAPGGLLEWPTTDVTELKGLYERLGVDAEYDFESKGYVLVVRGYGRKG